MAQEQLLRKAAIERLSSPEQLDTLMRVTSPMGWVALLSVGALIVGVVIWGFVGSLSVRVDGQGILLRGESVHAVEVASGGTLAKLEVGKGDVVSAGQIIARLSLPDVENQIVTARAQLAEMQSLETSQGGDMSQLQGNLRAQVGRLQHQRELKKQMVDKGLATQQSLLSIDQQISGIQSSLLQSQMGSGDRGSRVEDKRLDLKALETKLATDSLVKTAFAGRVVAILAGPGQQLRAGDKLVSLEAAEAPVSFIGFIPLAEGKKVTPGMEARISPSNVKSEEFGFMVGSIQSVSDFATTPEELKRTLNNEQLAQKFAETSPFQVVVAPTLDPKSPSGFKWTSSLGPPIRIGSGTFCTVQIIVERRKPISYVIPMIKQAVGAT
ncbi:MAG: NHLP bacteriocin system secretion protein [Acidobacteriota bacterium]